MPNMFEYKHVAPPGFNPLAPSLDDLKPKGTES